MSERITTTGEPDAVLAGLSRALLPGVRAAAVGYLEAFRDALTPYPPASEANRPGPRGRWYERGFGPRWRGGTGGRKTSQALGRSWTVAPTGAGAHLWSRASYSGAVHRDPASPGRPRQAAFHARRGWVHTGQALAELRRRRLVPRLLVTACKRAVGR